MLINAKSIVFILLLTIFKSQIIQEDAETESLIKTRREDAGEKQKCKCLNNGQCYSAQIEDLMPDHKKQVFCRCSTYYIGQNCETEAYEVTTSKEISEKINIHEYKYFYYEPKEENMYSFALDLCFGTKYTIKGLQQKGAIDQMTFFITTENEDGGFQTSEEITKPTTILFEQDECKSISIDYTVLLITKVKTIQKLIFGIKLGEKLSVVSNKTEKEKQKVKQLQEKTITDVSELEDSVEKEEKLTEDLVTSEDTKKPLTTGSKLIDSIGTKTKQIKDEIDTKKASKLNENIGIKTKQLKQEIDTKKATKLNENIGTKTKELKEEIDTKKATKLNENIGTKTKELKEEIESKTKSQKDNSKSSETSNQGSKDKDTDSISSTDKKSVPTYHPVPFTVYTQKKRSILIKEEEAMKKQTIKSIGEFKSKSPSKLKQNDDLYLSKSINLSFSVYPFMVEFVVFNILFSLTTLAAFIIVGIMIFIIRSRILGIRISRSLGISSRIINDLSHFSRFIPEEKYIKKEKKEGDTSPNSSETECAICLVKFEEMDTIRRTPCSHAFHKTCIDAWCYENLTCPMCRKNLTEKSLSEYYNSTALEIKNSPQSDQ